MPEKIMRMFESQFAEAITLPANDAALTLARWMAENRETLSGDDTDLLVAIGGALVHAGSEDRWRMHCPPPSMRRHGVAGSVPVLPSTP